jgi:hypothetical protein
MDQKWIDDLVNICMKPDMFKTTRQRIEEFVKKTEVCQTQFAKGEVTIDHVEDWCKRNGVRLVQEKNLVEPCGSLWLSSVKGDLCEHEKCLRCNACVDGAAAWKVPKGRFICGDCMYSEKKKGDYIPGSCPPLDCGRPKGLETKKRDVQKKKDVSPKKDRLDMKTLLDAKKAFLDGDYEKTADILEGKTKGVKIEKEAPKKIAKPPPNTQKVSERSRYKIKFYTESGGCCVEEEETAKTTKGVKRAIYEFAKGSPYLFCCYGIHIDITGKGKKIKLNTDDGAKCPIRTWVTKDGRAVKSQDTERVENALFGKEGEVILEKDDMSRLKLKFKRGYEVDYIFDWTFLEN